MADREAEVEADCHPPSFPPPFPPQFPPPGHRGPETRSASIGRTLALHPTTVSILNRLGIPFDVAHDSLELDWTNLPPGVESISLWASLHDGVLVGLRSDRLARTVDAELEIDHLATEAGLQPNTRFIFHFDQVRSVRARVGKIWPGPEPDLAGLSGEDRTRRTNEDAAKSRWESLAWPEAEQLASEGENHVSDSRLGLADGRVAWEVHACFGADTVWAVINIAAGRLSVGRSDGAAFDLPALMAMGRKYWDDFARGGSDTSDDQT